MVSRGAVGQRVMNAHTTAWQITTGENLQEPAEMTIAEHTTLLLTRSSGPMSGKEGNIAAG
jgi:hypothetical protein